MNGLKEPLPDTVTELTARRERILRHVVQEYVALAQPVPSDLIARKYEAELSPATVRNEMVALEEAGLITQPHTSAGRLPTERGLRPATVRKIHNTARGALRQAVRWSLVSKNVAVDASPPTIRRTEI